jgi:hypothetical protein
MERLKAYKENKRLFENQHVKVYEEQLRRIDRVIGNFSSVVNYPVILNYQRLMSLKMADLVMGEPPAITVPDTTEGVRKGTVDTEKQQIIDAFLASTDLFGKTYSAVIDLSRYGNALLILGKKTIGAEEMPIIKLVSPRPWFPVVDPINIDEVRYHVLAYDWLYDEEKSEYRLTVEIHKQDEPGTCERRTYELEGVGAAWKIGKEIREKGQKHPERLETQMGVCPVFVLSNMQTSDSVFGFDDYDSIDSLVSELIVRVSQVSKVLDKHADPSMSGPASALEQDQKTGEWRLRLSNYFAREKADEPAPEYITWDGSLTAAFKDIDVLTNMLYSLSEMGAAILGDISANTGQVPSGSALRRLMVSPLAKARRVAAGIDPVLKRIISAGASLYGVEILPEEITIKWNDGLPEDDAEQAQIMNTRTGGQATLSQYSAIRRMDNAAPDEVESELEQMREEAAGRAPALMPTFTPREDIADDEPPKVEDSS